MEQQFFLPMIPPTVTAQEKKLTVRGGKPVMYDSEEVKAAKAKLTAHLTPHKPENPICGEAVRLTVKWCFPMGDDHQNGEYKITKPDTDNLDKILKDCMTKCGFWKDDALVSSEIIEKFWSRVPGIFVKVETQPW
ncbi:MAG: RusA family crossover junction endodeoxyribonuclease [Oscillospiraceae bacterium]|nr:RusA family crossover junction endodeoxyribonuclease [Oscillospiraceae bacterium]